MSILAEKRKAKQLSLRKIEQATKIDRMKLWRLETGRQHLRIEDACLLAPILGCNPMDFFPELIQAATSPSQETDRKDAP